MSNWTRDQLLLALNLYHQTPFGRQHKSYPPIVALAEKIGRSPSAVAIKLSNFTSLDPVERARGIGGFPNVSQADRAIWEEFAGRLGALAEVSEALRESLLDDASVDETEEAGAIEPKGSSEGEAWVKVRRHQTFFRRAVIGSYEGRCCMSGMPVNEVLRASHIIPWRESEEKRADPANGLCLSATYDAAFDRGLISVSEDHRIMVSEILLMLTKEESVKSVFHAIKGVAIRLPAKNLPDADCLAWHREMLFAR